MLKFSTNHELNYQIKENEQNRGVKQPRERDHIKDSHSAFTSKDRFRRNNF